MKKMYMLFLIAIFSLNLAFVSALKTENTPIRNIVISEMGEPTTFDITIDVEGVTQEVDVFAPYPGFVFNPGILGEVEGVKTYRFTVYLPEKISRFADNYRVEYVVNGKKSQAVKDVLRIEVIDAKDVLDLSVIDVEYGADTAELIIKNKINQSIEDLPLEVESLFFNEKLILDFEPLEEKTIELKVNRDEVKKLPYGAYVVEFQVNNTRSVISSDINYIQKENSEISKQTKGLLVRKTTYTRINTGNTELVGDIEASKDVFSRLFTVTSVEPSTSERSALVMRYSWNKELAPGESFAVTVTTNYTLPFILIVLIIFVAIFVTAYVRTNIILDKRVSYVKTKGGEFALKVRIHVKARKYVENVQITDRLPGMTQLYEKFGIKPDRIDPSTRRLMWDIPRLNAGEERVYSYVIFSKVSVIGRFELPSASAEYQREGKTEQAISNRAFFVAETGV